MIDSLAGDAGHVRPVNTEEAVLACDQQTTPPRSLADDVGGPPGACMIPTQRRRGRGGG